ncbi:hypothetical protein [Spirosoma rigui]|uniref:hypothetical protein n=1 Tax=Spirosoma rigui TaxID=564064 RepID=UPI0012D31C81|nr:hypothetical protein [Spirosoma rigui]
MKLTALSPFVIFISLVSAQGGLAQSDTLPAGKSHKPSMSGTQPAPPPMIMPGVQLNTSFSTLPAQSPSVGKAAPAWLRTKTSGSPMYVIDGKSATAAQLKAIRQLDVASVNVLDGDRATALYGKNARDGLVIITTRKAVNR